MKTLIHCDCMLGPSDPSPRCTSCFGTGTPFELFERDRFVNGLRILHNLDRHELVEAGVLDAGDTEGWWAFQAQPPLQVMRMGDERLNKLWPLVEVRQPHRLRACICEGCGTAWTDGELAIMRHNDPKVLSCCPERRMVPRYGHTAPRV